MLPSIKRITKIGPEVVDLFTYRFTETRSIWLLGEVNDRTAAEICLQLEYLDGIGSEDILLYINSPGGSVAAGLSIVDAIRRCRCDVVTIATGIAASMGAFILSCGTKGKRYVTPLAEVMIHQPLGGAQGQASDIELVARHIVQTKMRLNQVLAENTGHTVEEVALDSDRDCYMTAQQAIDYGIADCLLKSNELL
ncbi:ATP-dependent Clp protease proteolytic subunit [Gemmiger sp. An50]|uniref:ClpP family protease n=1 Tax=Gemmiger sp. An50 TaxID=1965639 RepID=UPI000B390A7F|nr:ATP-dependent Clp protease proteolytic subunit [Gemmiger sp. An50]OUN83763.1 hypothetical protein B5G03_14215 [Gemmiger sp. An50]